MRAEREAAARAPKSTAGRAKAKSCEQLALEYYHGPGSALQQAARGGGTSGDFLTEHGTIEMRISALVSGKYELEILPGKYPQLHASFKGVRKQVVDTVQYLDTDQLKQVVRAIATRGTTSRGRGGSSHLLKPREMAARSPSLLWSMAHAFGGDVDGGVAMLLSAEE